MTKQPKPTSGALFKLSGDIHGWKSIILREVNIVEGTYLVKVDGWHSDTNKIEQVQLLFTERDAAHLSHCLEIQLLKSESGKQALKFTREIHAINHQKESEN